MRRIVTIVEGHGEVEAVPVLLRRIAATTAPDTAVEIAKPIRVGRRKIMQAGELERAVRLAAARADTNGSILLPLDADDDCPAALAEQALERTAAARPDRPVRVVLAKVEYEAWFLAAAASLAGQRGPGESLAPPDDPEAVRDAKGWLSARMPPGQRYRETLHQAALSAVFDLDSARAAPSFDKLWRDLSSLLRPPET